LYFPGGIRTGRKKGRDMNGEKRKKKKKKKEKGHWKYIGKKTVASSREAGCC